MSLIDVKISYSEDMGRKDEQGFQDLALQCDFAPLFAFQKSS